ncbi:hypothetical protein GOV04_02910 [Candidatus Woesearchaeota archaeon]|nr:hypothetical protein [Candidatus Woesearchaeota archaeon]
MLRTITSLLIAFLGLFGGNLLAMIAPEELQPGKKHFLLLQKILLALIIILAFDGYWILLGISLGIMFSWIIKSNKELYYFLPVFMIPYIITNKLILGTSLLFLYSLPTGTLIATQFVKKDKLTIKKIALLKYTLKNHYWFAVVSIIITITTLFF